MVTSWESFFLEPGIIKKHWGNAPKRVVIKLASEIDRPCFVFAAVPKSVFSRRWKLWEARLQLPKPNSVPAKRWMLEPMNSGDYVRDHCIDILGILKDWLLITFNGLQWSSFFSNAVQGIRWVLKYNWVCSLLPWAIWDSYEFFLESFQENLRPGMTFAFSLGAMLSKLSQRPKTSVAQLTSWSRWLKIDAIKHSFKLTDF